MSKLLEKINADLKQAMIEKRAEDLSALRMLLAALRNKEIALRQGGQAELSDDQAVEVIGSEIKKRRDAIESYEQAGRNELAAKEKAEIKIFAAYMPEQLNDKEIEEAVAEVVASIGEVAASDFGRVMGQAMGKLKGKADGGKVGEIVKKVLASK
jgi:hypothetical protein